MEKENKRNFFKVFFICVILWLILHLSINYPNYNIFTIGLILTTLLGISLSLLLFYSNTISLLLLGVFLVLWIIFQFIIRVWSIIYNDTLELILTFVVTFVVIWVVGVIIKKLNKKK